MLILLQTIPPNIVGKESWLESAHKYGIDFFFGVVLLAAFLIVLRWLMRDVNKVLEAIVLKLTELDTIRENQNILPTMASAVSGVATKANGLKDIAGDASRAAEDADEVLGLLNARTSTINEIIQNNKTCHSQHQEVIKVLENCKTMLIQISTRNKLVEDMPVTLKVMSGDMKTMANQLELMLKTIISKVEKGG
jgi:hypothetical protein